MYGIFHDMAASTPDLPPLLGQAQPFLELMEAASRVAPLDRPVLVIGERGSRTGFERMAERALAYLRSRTADHWLMFAAGVVLGLMVG